MRFPLIAFLALLCAVQLMPGVFITSSVMDPSLPPVASNDVYFWMQLVAFPVIVLIVSYYFEETFRKASAHYIRTFNIGTLKVIFFRYLRLLAVLELVYLPFVYICILRANNNILYNMEFFNMTFDLIDPAKPMLQCAVFMLFSVTAALFFMTVLKNKVFTFVSAIAISIMEISIFPIVLHEYSLFHGSGELYAPDYFSFFPPNTVITLILSAVMLAVSLVLYSMKR